MKFAFPWLLSAALAGFLMACGSTLTSNMPAQTLGDPNAPPGPGKGHGPADPNDPNRPKPPGPPDPNDPNRPKPPGPPDPNAPPPPAPGANCQAAAFQGMPSPVICGNATNVMLRFDGPFTTEPNITISSGAYSVSGVTQAAPGPCTFSFTWDPNGVANGNYTATLTETGSTPVALPFTVNDDPGCKSN